MKKKIYSLLILVLCVALVFTFIACGPKDDGKNNTTTGIKGVTAAELAEAKAAIESYIDSWMVAHAQDVDGITDQSDLLISDLAAFEASTLLDSEVGTVYPPTIQVTFDAQTRKYAISISWNRSAVKYTFSKDLQLVNYGEWAGELSRPNANAELLEEAAADTLAELMNAAFKTINTTYNGARTGVFSASAIAWLEVMGNKYGIEVKGNFNLENAEETEIAISLVNESEEVLGALYYIGGATAEDCKLVLQYGDTYKYINYVVANEWLQNVFTANPDASGNLLGEIDSFSGFLQDTFGVDATASGAITGILNMLTYTYQYVDDAGNTTYLLDLNLAAIISQASSLIAQFGLSDVVSETLSGVPVLNELDIATMSGLLGHITIAGIIDAEGYLTDFELAVNIAESTLRFSDAEDARTIGIPCVNVALAINNYNFPDETIADVIPEEANDAEYFSPTNINLSGDLYIKHVDGEETVIDSTYTFEVVTDINPFKPSKSEASIVIDEVKADETVSTNFLTVIYKQSDKTIWLKGTVLDDVGATYYYFDFADLSEIRDWVGYNTTSNFFDGINISAEGVLSIDTGVATSALQAIFASDLGNYVINKYYQEKVADTAEVSGAIMDTITDSYEAVKALYEQFVKDGNIEFSSENASLKVEITPEQINTVIEAINTVFATEIDDIDDPEYVNLYFNYEKGNINYADQLYVEVKFGGKVYTLLGDNSEEDVFTLTFTMTTSNRIYTAVLTAEDNVETESATKWVLSFNFTITNLQKEAISDTEVSLSDFHINWGGDNTGKVATVPGNATQEDVFAEGSLADTILDKAIDLLGDDESQLYGIAKYVAGFVIRKLI